MKFDEKITSIEETRIISWNWFLFDWVLHWLTFDGKHIE
ncbi:hypothetical protein SynMVIR181_01917 [Synechococcus sp. MVIR-18-1]|nr:hypothetical protein SynMVIR181_01917 [Synechococcus sp. MVIR-18-1]